MVSSTYRTGTWLGIVRSGSVIVLESNTNPDIVNQLWDFLGQDPTIHGVLNEVTNQFGTGLTGLPSFAILVQSDKLHAILRGDITLIAHLNGSAEVVSGRDVSTWSERSLVLPESLELTMADPEADDNALDLAVSEAVVRLQSLLLDTAGDRVAEGVAANDEPVAAELASSHEAESVSADTEFDADAPATVWAADDETAVELAPVTGWAQDTEADLDGTTVYFPTAGTEQLTDQDTGDHSDAALSAHGAAYAESPAFTDETAANETVPEEQGASLAKDDWFAPEEEAAGQATEEQATRGQFTEAESSEELFSEDDSSAPDVDAPSAHENTHEDTADEADAYAGFAMAAEAADAEWVAQLAPVQANDADAINDLNLTIRPDMHDEDSAAGDSPEAEYPGEQFTTDAEQFDSASHTPEQHDGSQDQDQDQDQDQPDESDQDSDGSAVEDPATSSPADDGSFTTSYDHLWGPTVTRSVEDAAVRLDENGLPITSPNADPVLPPLPSLPPLTGTGHEGAQDSQDSESAQYSPETASTTGALDTAAGEEPAPSLMIDSVPWGKPGAPDAQESLPQDQHDQQEQQGEAAENQPFDPDHDGQTVMSSDVKREESLAAATSLESRPPTGPMVLARLCLHGHANPPSRSQCSDCGAVLNSEPREVGRPRLGTMHISSGESVELDHSLIIGRQPSVSRVMGGAMPRLVQVKSGNDDISRSHVEVRLDGWDVLLVDLKATNGTVLVREGQAPRRLSQGEEAILLNGDIAELGDGISLLFDGLL